jgi:hypothetical protein
VECAVVGVKDELDGNFRGGETETKTYLIAYVFEDGRRRRVPRYIASRRENIELEEDEPTSPDCFLA